MKLYVIDGKIFRNLKKAERYALKNGMPKHWVIQEKTSDRNVFASINSKHVTVAYYIDKRHFTIMEKQVTCVPYTDRNRRDTEIWYMDNPANIKRQGQFAVYISKWVDGLTPDQEAQQLAETELKTRLSCFQSLK